MAKTIAFAFESVDIISQNPLDHVSRDKEKGLFWWSFSPFAITQSTLRPIKKHRYKVLRGKKCNRKIATGHSPHQRSGPPGARILSWAEAPAARARVATIARLNIVVFQVFVRWMKECKVAVEPRRTKAKASRQRGRGKGWKEMGIWKWTRFSARIHTPPNRVTFFTLNFSSIFLYRFWL